jgi:predicted RNase H-like HicB family nuclease
MAKLDLTAAVWQEGDWFVAECVELGVASQGRSEDEAMRNLQEAVLLYLQDDETGEIKAPLRLRKIRSLVVSG